MEIEGHDIQLKHLDKVFFPEAGLTKGDLVDYYRSISAVMVPLIAAHPVSMQRFPDGLEGEGFYNKDTPDYFPDWITRVSFPKREGGSFDAPVIDSAAALVYLADQAMITPHLYLSRIGDLEHPDRMIYDLDPPDETRDYDGVRQAALDVRGVLGELGLQCWVQTTGSQGFHVVVPLDGTLKFDAVREFAQDVSRVLIHRKPAAYTLEDPISKRGGRIFLDTLRNSYGATAVAPYGVRARPQASVATPVEWAEVEGGVNPRDWTVRNLPKRMAEQSDPWRDMADHPQHLQSSKPKLQALLYRE